MGEEEMLNNVAFPSERTSHCSPPLTPGALSLSRPPPRLFLGSNPAIRQAVPVSLVWGPGLERKNPEELVRAVHVQLLGSQMERKRNGHLRHLPSFSEKLFWGFGVCPLGQSPAALTPSCGRVYLLKAGVTEVRGLAPKIQSLPKLTLSSEAEKEMGRLNRKRTFGTKSESRKCQKHVQSLSPWDLPQEHATLGRGQNGR